MERAVEEEDYDEAIRLRDWASRYKEMYESFKPLMEKALEEDDYEQFHSYINDLYKHKSLM